MSFPTELPRTAITELLGLFTPKSDRTPARIALAAYDLTGYGLYLVYGDAKYLMGLDPKAISILNEIEKLLASGDFAKWADILKFIFELATAKYSWPIIAFKVVRKFGPQVVVLLVKIRELLKG